MSMSSRTVRVAFLGLVAALGVLPTYASKDPLVTSDQSKLMEQRKKYLKRYAPAIRESLSGNESSVLVLMHISAGTPPIVLSGDDPVEMAGQRPDVVKSADGCELVYRPDLALAPVPLNCALLERQAQDRKSQREREEQTNASLAELGKGIEDLKTDTVALAQATRKAEEVLERDEALIKADEQSLDEHQQALNKHADLLDKNAESLKRTKAEIANSQNVIGKTMKVVTIQQAELEGVGDNLKTLEQAYKNTTDVVGKNNQQIDSMIADLNTAFAQLQKRLDDMKQKLDSIK